MLQPSDSDDSSGGVGGWKRAALVSLKFAVVAAVLLFVGQTARDAWRNLVAERVAVNLPIALASGFVFLVSMAPMAWFWRQSLLALGQPAPPLAALRAFYVSQLGKYVPGKASVVLIRTERLLAAVRCGRPQATEAGSGRLVAATVFYETLTHMAVGALIAATLTSLVVPVDAGTRTVWITLALGLVVVCIAPTLPPVFAWLLRRVALRRNDAIEAQVSNQLTYGLTARGVVASCVAWTLGGVSVWLAALSVSAASPSDSGRLPLWVLAAALPVVAGFVSLLPAGVVVREGLSLALLAPALGEGPALATTLAVRVIWVASEVALCGSLLLGEWARRPRRDSPVPPEDNR